MTEHARWLRNLAIGDEVAIVSPDICVEIERVARTDQKRVIVLCGDDRAYRRSDGGRVGLEIEERIEPVTSAHRDAIERRDLVRWLRALPSMDPTLEQLRAMRQAYDATRSEP